MAKPAATIGHLHICPKVTAKVPHVGGPVVAGSPNVLIGNMPAARQGDMAICVGPPDSISSGSSTVKINGKPAARLGDGTSHGGKIVIGNPTVLIGG
ncbi:PAAR domain-containing protein [Pseudoalteromonas mariniglutinosa]|uniref:PAAR domain-containing protein n=1 Tax=Pseudoalteromonas mariniglutinosa TaxID=206042 RepID=UPI003850C817